MQTIRGLKVMLMKPFIPPSTVVSQTMTFSFVSRISPSIVEWFLFNFVPYIIKSTDLPVLVYVETCLYHYLFTMVLFSRWFFEKTRRYLWRKRNHDSHQEQPSFWNRREGSLRNTGVVRGFEKIEELCFCQNRTKKRRLPIKWGIIWKQKILIK